LANGVKLVKGKSNTMTRTFSRILVPVLVIGAFLALTMSASASTRVEHSATLKGATGFTAVTGKARFREDSGKRELQVEVENARALVGKTLTVKVDGVSVGTMKVDSFGVARLVRRSVAGQLVPAVHAGSRIPVTYGTAPVATGTFA
jgi:hypothetical protein